MKPPNLFVLILLLVVVVYVIWQTRG